MTDFTITGSLHTISITSEIDRLVRSNDPYLQKMLEEEMRQIISRGGHPLKLSMTEQELINYSRTYGEQYVANPCADLDQYFDIVNGRIFSRTIPTQLIVLYLFGSGKHYRPNIGALSAAGEAVAGYCLESLGYKSLVRPLGIMPDAVFCIKRNGGLRLALAEAKASTGSEPYRMLVQNVFQFLVDIKTRATGFGNHYEGYLVCSKFKDGRKIDCACLHVDLQYYFQSKSFSNDRPEVLETVTSFSEPGERLKSIIRLQAEVHKMQDEYLTSLLSEEAVRSATLELFKQNRPPKNPNDVERYIRDIAAQLRLDREWDKGQDLVKTTKGKEEDLINRAIEKYGQLDLDLEKENH